MKMIFLTEDEFRAIIREEYKNFKPELGARQEDEPPVTQQEICRFLNISEPTIIRWREKRGGNGGIPFLKIGSRILYQKKAVLAYLQDKKGPKNGK